jgi:hypothetical protein
MHYNQLITGKIKKLATFFMDYLLSIEKKVKTSVSEFK